MDHILFRTNDNKYNRTYQALTNLYINCRNIQEIESVKLLRNRDQLAHAKEFGTISMCGSRQSGHTTAIARLLNNLTGKWIVIDPNLAMSKRKAPIFRSKLDKHRIKKCTKHNITAENIDIDFISIHQIDNMRGLEVDGLIVDCACFIKRKQKEELYRTCLPCMKFKDYVFFMFIG